MKSLLLRLDVNQYSQEQLDAINQMFSTYYSSVTFLDIEEQRRKLQDLILNTDCKVLSMDKFIPLEYNIDVLAVLVGTQYWHNWRAMMGKPTPWWLGEKVEEAANHW